MEENMAKTNIVKYLKIAAVTTALTAISMPLQANPWTGFDKEGGDATLAGDLMNDGGDGVTNIIQNGSLFIGGNTNGLDILTGQAVEITQDNAQALFVAKDTSADSNPTQILGSLSTRLNGGGVGGSVMILDTNGIFFGTDSVIDTGGIIASSGQLNNQKLIDDGEIELSNFGTGSSVEITNGATMLIGNTGLGAFVAPTVVNNGVIAAVLGRVELAATNTVTTVDLYGDGLIEIALDETNTEVLSAVNNGTVVADGGVIHMTAGAAEDIVDSIVNMNGVARAQSVASFGGKIVLGGENTGRVDVNTEVISDEITVTAQQADLNADLNASIVNGSVETIMVESNTAEIQDGIDIAAMGAEVNIAAGTYAGDITVDKSLTLRGAQAGVDARTRNSVPETIIQMNSPAFTVNANNAVIDGFTVDGGSGGDAAIMVNNANNTQVINTIINNVTGGASAHGIALNNAQFAILQRNQISNVQGNGISTLGNMGGLNANFNLIENTGGSGIAISEGVGVASLLLNQISNAGTSGIFVDGAAGSLITTNSITSGATTQNAIQMIDSLGNGVSATTFLTNNTISGNGNDTGISIENSDFVTSFANVITGTKTAIGVNDSNDTYVAGNQINAVENGIIFEGEGINNFIAQNNISDFADTGVVLLGTTGLTVFDNTVTSTNSNTIGMDILGAVDTKIIGDRVEGNTFNGVETAIRLIADNGTTIDGNTLTNANNGIQSGGTPASILTLSSLSGVPLFDLLNYAVALTGQQTSNLVVTNNTISDATRAITLSEINGLRIGGTGEEGNMISNSGGMRVTDSLDVKILGNNMHTITGDAIFVANANDADISNNNIEGVSLGNGVILSGGGANDIMDNIIENADFNGIVMRETTSTFVGNNTVNSAMAAGILVDGSIDTIIAENTFNGNGAGVQIAGFDSFLIPVTGLSGLSVPFPFGGESDNTTVSGNTITESTTAGISTNGNAVGSVTLSSNELSNNTIGMSFEGGDIDMSDLANPNTVTGGETGMIFAPNFFSTEGETTANPLSLVNNTLGSTIFDGQTGNFVELFNDALFEPGEPTIIDGLAVSWDGLVPFDSPLGAGIITAAQRAVIEARLIDFDDDATVGQIITGLGFDPDEEDTFISGLFSLNVPPSAISLTFTGLPPVSIDFTALEPAAGTAEEETSVENQNPEDIEPAAGVEEGCWAAVNETGFEGTVTFNFGGTIDNTLSDSACAAGQAI